MGGAGDELAMDYSASQTRFRMKPPTPAGEAGAPSRLNASKAKATVSARCGAAKTFRSSSLACS
jgi:hypothetical protein